MSQEDAQLTLQQTRLQFGGVVHFDNAQKVCDAGLKLLKTAPKTITIDMSQLQSSSSVVVAILVLWLRAASQQQQVLQFCHMPSKLCAIIGVSGLSDVLPQTV